MADYNLGTASGSIRADTSQLKQASKDIAAFVDQTRAKLNELKGTKGLSLLTAAMKTEQEQIKAATAQFVQNSQKEITALQNAAKAKSDATKLEIQQSKTRIEQMRIEANERLQMLRQQERSSRQQQQGSYRQPMTAGMPAGMPFFASFTLMPFSAMAAAAGQQQLSNSLMTGGAALGIVDTLPIIDAQFKGITQRFKEMGGVMGVLGTVVNAVVSPLGLIAAGIAAVSLVLIEINRQFEEAKQKADAYVEAQVKLNQLIAQGATETDLQAQVDEQTGTRTGLIGARNTLIGYQASIDMMRALLADSEGAMTLATPGSASYSIAQQNRAAALGGLDSMSAELASKFPETGGNLDAVSIAIGGLNVKITEFDGSILGLEAAMQSAAVQANTAAAAETARRDMLISEAETFYSTKQQAMKWTRAQRDEEYQALDDRLNYVRSHYDTASAEQQAAYDQEINNIKAAQQAIASVTQSTADLALAASRTEALAKGIRDGVEQAQQAALSLTRTLEDRAIAAFKAMEDRLTSVSREAEDYARTRMYAIIDFLKEMEKAEEDYNKRVEEIQENFDEEEADRLEDHLLEMERIRRRAQTDILNAAMRLDAIGIYEAKRRRDEDLREAEEDYQLQKDRRKEAFEEQLEDEKQQFEDLKREREAAFREQLRREDEQRSIRQSREEADWQKQLSRQAQQYALEDQRRQQDYALRVAQMMQHNQILQGVVDAGLNGIRFAWNYVLGQIQSDTIAMGAGAVAGTPDHGSPWAGWAAATPMAAGGSRSTTSVRVDSIVLGDIGDRSDDQVVQLIDRGLRSFFAGGTIAMRG